MRRLFISVENMFLEYDEMVEKFWSVFIHKYEEIKTALEQVEKTARVKDSKVATKVYVEYGLLEKIIGHEGAPYYYTLTIYPSNYGAFPEYEDCCELQVCVCNVGG